ncbi:hypothetical protein OOK41_15165 [Micromonospora sp. NBC_01655]|uniref:hypothetical protein n=1 Tax=Micromonospora sp. NBC_01655 TaxID=2975983 RepID=UPI002254F547|nr:hypothetical protein [Micromonospora sp. NBC_01655]MCX4471625.1 hypothetical protein [Micromonospora sp. NBC_01655]
MAGAAELTYLADHPDPHLRDALDSTLRAYRGPGARRLRERLRLGSASVPDPTHH